MLWIFLNNILMLKCYQSNISYVELYEVPSMIHEFSPPKWWYFDIWSLWRLTCSIKKSLTNQVAYRQKCYWLRCMTKKWYLGYLIRKFHWPLYHAYCLWCHCHLEINHAFSHVLKITVLGRFYRTKVQNFKIIWK